MEQGKASCFGDATGIPPGSADDDIGMTVPIEVGGGHSRSEGVACCGQAFALVLRDKMRVPELPGGSLVQVGGPGVGSALNSLSWCAHNEIGEAIAVDIAGA